jgi:hypothetical protein
MEELPDKHIPSCLKPPKDLEPLETNYGIGIEHRPNEVGMFYGPYKDIYECLEHVPAEEGKIFIYELPTGRKMYRWNKHERYWVGL